MNHFLNVERGSLMRYPNHLRWVCECGSKGMWTAHTNTKAITKRWRSHMKRNGE